MLAFLDFEASSLGKYGYPIEVAWMFEDGTSESHLIRPAQTWYDWDPVAAAIHGIDRTMLLARGTPHEVVARRMVEALIGHDLLASAPSWDGKWLSALLRAGGLPRHALRLRDTGEAQAEAAERRLRHVLDGDALTRAIGEVVTSATMRHRERPPAHRALADAREERELWLAVGRLADERAASRRWPLR